MSIPKLSTLRAEPNRGDGKTGDADKREVKPTPLCN